MDDEAELSRMNKNKIVIDNVTKTTPHTARESQFDFKNPLEIDELLYALAMESTQVVADLLSWPDYDNTEIGRAFRWLMIHLYAILCYIVLHCYASMLWMKLLNSM